MKFSELIGESKLTGKIEIENDFEVTGLAYDSRKVKPGNIYFAIKGMKDDGNKYVNDAINNGAEIIFTEDKADQSSNRVHAVEIRKLMAELSGIFFGKPSEKIKLIGVTGTNGKTTTTFLIKYFLEKRGYKTGLMGTIDYEFAGTRIDSNLTTPDSVELNMMLADMVKSGMKFCVMEVSSIALTMERVYGLNYDTAVFTNLTSEHLDFHSDMGNYFLAKKKLFDELKSGAHAISNRDDEYGVKMLEDTAAEKFYYSVKSESDLKSFNEKLSLDGLSFDILYNSKTYSMKSNLAGRFNIYNILASVSAVLNYDVDMDSVNKWLAEFPEVSGRFNRVKLPNGAIAVIDYSHTSDSIRNAIESAREIVNEERKEGRVITVFGCGGNKDRTKRPVMGKLATTLSDYAIITSDNPRFEDPMKIIDEILTGISAKKNFEIIENRESAIKRGLELSGKGDIVLICGKGHETYQEVNGVRSHFDDREIVLKHQKSAAGKC